VTTPLVRVDNLRKTYRQNFWNPSVTAVSGISLSVSSGVIFGFLGPNGAGKTTTIKVLTGLIQPTSGTASLFGVPVHDPKARARLGFLPENPYVYPYLTAREFVELSARLSGLGARAAKDQTNKLLEHVGIAYAADRPARKLSKGMLQRTGLAAALVADPELLILDEPMSGLDPVGRKEVRDLIVHERAAGRTIFFSSHILNDVETLCDEVAILRKGVVVVSGRLDTLLRSDVKRWEVVFERNDAWQTALATRDVTTHVNADRIRVEVEGLQALQALLGEALGHGAIVHEVIPRQESLEQLFLRNALSEGHAG
jgi:ABC-2 type transport system ATP-binding protein